MLRPITPLLSPPEALSDRFFAGSLKISRRRRRLPGPPSTLAPIKIKPIKVTAITLIMRFILFLSIPCCRNRAAALQRAFPGSTFILLTSLQKKPETGRDPCHYSALRHILQAAF